MKKAPKGAFLCSGFSKISPLDMQYIS